MALAEYNGPDFGETITSKSSVNKGKEVNVTNISDPNALFDFASYNVLFTLSGLNQQDITNTTSLLKSKPHDIIVASAGIGDIENGSRTTINADDQKIIDENVRLQGALEKSQRVLSQNRDLYIKSVNMNSIPGLNEKRRLTSVTDISMEIVEPAGITLLEKIRGAAINNGYLDHLDAPYLLTIDFKGFDEMGQPVISDSKAFKRVIPIKLVDMQMDVNQAGTVYSVKAIPYNEFAYVNRYNYPRTAGTLSPNGRKLSDVFKTLEALLNKQNEDEKKQKLVDKPDTYEIHFDKADFRDVGLEMDNLIQSGMATPGSTGADGGWYVAAEQSVPPDYMKITTNNAITKILEEIMKGHPDFSDKKFDQFKQKCERQLGAAQFKGGAEAVYKAAQAEEFFFPYFKIRASVVPLGEFDLKRATQRKHITYHVEKYKVHAYSLAIPGVSTGKNFENFVFKTYNYLFTGENLDVLDVNINYKVAYFQSRLKDFEATDERKNTIVNTNEKRSGTTNSKEFFGDGTLLTKSEVGTAKGEGTGKTGGTPTQLDAFLDSLTHPLADMVNLRMEILGDPAWLGQSQFIPVKPAFKEGLGMYSDTDIDVWRANRDRIWNPDLRCYNTDVAEPIILFKFRMPTDINNETGLYELEKSQSAEFSGLYRVIQIEHNFTDGKYTNVLQLTRFNNQGVNISDPEPIKSYSDKAGNILNESEAKRINNKFTKDTQNLISLARKFENLVKKIKGFIS